jgi:hypothetical protein
MGHTSAREGWKRVGDERTEQASSVHIGGEEATVAGKRAVGGEAGHVGYFHYVLQVLSWIPTSVSWYQHLADDRREDIRKSTVNIDPILPLEFRPHAAEL